MLMKYEHAKPQSQHQWNIPYLNRSMAVIVSGVSSIMQSESSFSAWTNCTPMTVITPAYKIDQDRRKYQILTLQQYSAQAMRVGSATLRCLQEWTVPLSASVSWRLTNSIPTALAWKPNHVWQLTIPFSRTEEYMYTRLMLVSNLAKHSRRIRADTHTCVIRAP